jgi:hypothetical protein
VYDRQAASPPTWHTPAEALTPTALRAQATTTAADEDEEYSLFGANLRLLRVWPCGPKAPSCRYGRRMNMAVGGDLALSQMKAAPVLRVRTKVPHALWSI